MKRSLALAAALLIGCGSSTCKNKPEPAPPVSIPDAGPTAEPTAAPSVQPVPEQVIDWRTPEEVMGLGMAHPNLCMMAYFPDAVTGDDTIETTTFVDQELVELLNKTFVSMKFPVTPDTALMIMEEFKITKLPTLIMAPANDALVFQVEGNVPAANLKTAIEEYSKEGQLFEKCAEERAKL